MYILLMRLPDAKENALDAVHTQDFNRIEGRARLSIRAVNASVIIALSGDKDKR
jgi:hypothetical protein